MRVRSAPTMPSAEVSWSSAWMGDDAQEDGTLEALLSDAAALGEVLEALCGVTRKREAEADIRNSLAESVEMLVRFLAIMQAR